MSSNMFAILAIICIAMAVAFFFIGTSEFFVNSITKKFWFQAEKCYLNFELMFMDEKFNLARCRVLVLAATCLGMCLSAYIAWNAPQKILLYLLISGGGIVGWVLPGFVTSLMHKRYVNNFETQLLDGITMLGSSLRSGLSLLQAMEMVANEMPKPISQEFRLLISEYNYGITLDEGMERMAKRVPSEDLGIVMEAILILRSTGANLVETFEIIVHTIRERKKIEDKVKTMTSMGVSQAVILMSMPFVLMFVLHKLNPTYLTPLFSTTVGWIMLAIMVAMVTLGGLLIKNIVTIDV